MGENRSLTDLVGLDHAEDLARGERRADLHVDAHEDDVAELRPPRAG
jgi:hypothetical protein